MTNEKQNVNREYKDRLFKLVFGEKEELTTHRAEVKDMLLTEYNEELHIKNEKELAEAEGEARGEARLSKLVQILLELNDHAAIIRITKDEAYRKELYEKYKI